MHIAPRVFLHLWVPTWNSFFLLEGFTFALGEATEHLDPFNDRWFRGPAWWQSLWGWSISGSLLFLGGHLVGFRWRTRVASQGLFSLLSGNSRFCTVSLQNVLLSFSALPLLLQLASIPWKKGLPNSGSSLVSSLFLGCANSHYSGSS